MSECIRCNNIFEQSIDLQSHFSTICYECRQQSPEMLADQIAYNIKQYQNANKR